MYSKDNLPDYQHLRAIKIELKLIKTPTSVTRSFGKLIKCIINPKCYIAVNWPQR